MEQGRIAGIGGELSSPLRPLENESPEGRARSSSFVCFPSAVLELGGFMKVCPLSCLERRKLSPTEVD